ncbi:uncharacterized protein LOC124659466 [Lolium rigidum]|uniref:uncharacterized protein LOC124659466 n=1 Tax=Lolium rigidum TaxID=89674 RepID=UPI001F5DD73C|nr:uncharacterized protein LOC124659466 [Lolium rigidum]
MPPSSTPIVVLSDTESGDDEAAFSRPAAEYFTSSLCTQAEVDALCEKHGVPKEFAARPAGELHACTPPPPGAVCVYAHALESGLRFPLHPFFSEALSHFGLAPGQLTPNGWRVLVGFVVICRSAGVPPSLAAFRHFFSVRTRFWSFFVSKNGAGALFTGLTHSKSDREWKRGFFFLTSSQPWPCPVHWGEQPSKIFTTSPVLSSQDNKSVAKIVYSHGPAVDLRTYLSVADLAAAFSTNPTEAPPPPSLQLSPRSTGSEGMDLSADEAVAPPEKMEAEPVGDTPQLSSKKRKLEEVATAKDGLRRSEPNTPPAARPGLHAPPLSGCLAPGLRAPPVSDQNPRHLPVPDAHGGDGADWEEAWKVLDSIVPPGRQHEFAAAKPSNVVKSSFVAFLQAANYVSYSLNYALELDEKQRAHERDIAVLREQLQNAKAERKNAQAELAAARQATAAEVESAKTAAVQQFLGSKEYTRRVAEQALPAYERGAEDMKGVALRLNPRLDAASWSCRCPLD